MGKVRAPFAERLKERAQRLAAGLVVGIDPHPGRFPAALARLEPEAALATFACGVLEAVAPHVVAVKPQVAFFERWGWRGWRALQELLESATALDVPVILDAKRGDIGSTASAYAEGLLGDLPGTPGPHVDALTLQPYLGGDSLTPFIEHAVRGGRGLFVLARTSNPGARDFQDLESGGEPLYRSVARAIEAWGQPHRGSSGYSPIGMVAAATYPDELLEVRAAAPGALILIPGLGAQGGSIEDLLPAFDRDGWGALPSSSRGVIYAWERDPGARWQDAVAHAATQTNAQLRAGLAERTP